MKLISILTTFAGTGVTAKIVGENTGVAKNAEVVIVGSGTESSRGADSVGHKQYLFFDALVKIHNYIEKHGIYGKCIINISSGWWRPYMDVLDNYDGFAQIYGDLLSHVFRRITNRYNCYLVIAAGNLDPSHGISELPQALVAQMDPKKALVVGGHDLQGNNIFQFDKVRISALAKDLTIARGYPLGYQFNSTVLWRVRCAGTSFSAPVIAGLLANFISIGHRDPVGYLLALSKNPPNPREPRIAFNGIFADQWPVFLRPNGYVRPPGAPKYQQP